MLQVDKKKDPGAKRADALVDLYGQNLYALALGRLRNADQAKIFVRETFLSASKAQRSAKNISEEQARVTKMLNARIVGHFYKMFKEKPFEDQRENEAAINSFFDQDGRHKKLDPKGSAAPGRTVGTKEFWPVFFSLLQQMPVAVAEAYYLREVDQAAPQEICEILNVSPDTLQMMLHRARLQMCRSWERLFPERAAQA